MKIVFTPFCIFSLLLCSMYSSAQQVTMEWVQRYKGIDQTLPDEAKALAVDDSGNVYVTGYSFTANTNEGKDFMTLKYDSTGDLLWQRAHNGPYGRDDVASGVAIDPWGNIIVTGQTLDSYVHYTITAIKYDPAGNVLWTASYAPEGIAGSIAVAMKVDSLGNTYVTGTGDTTGIDKDFITVKFDSAGNVVWHQRYGDSSGYDRVQAIALDNWLNVYVTGWSDGFTVVKYDAAGTEQWVKKWYNPQGGGTRSENVTVDDSGNVYVIGYRGIIAGNTDAADMIAIKYDTHGVLQWQKTYAGPNESADYGYFIGVDRAGNVYAFGSTETSDTSGSDYLLIKYNAAGVQQWVKTYAPANCLDCRDVAQGLFLDENGNIYISGNSHVAGFPFHDYLTAKYTPDGVQQWVQTYDGDDDDIPQDIFVDAQGYVYVTGKSMGTFVTTNWDYLTVKYKQTFAPAAATTINKAGFILSSYPNPTSGVSTITYSLEHKAFVRVELFDALGRRIRVLASSDEMPGLHKMSVDVSTLPTGLYPYIFSANGEIATGKIQVLR